jgi:hypothetical protein
MLGMVEFWLPCAALGPWEYLHVVIGIAHPSRRELFSVQALLCVPLFVAAAVWPLSRPRWVFAGLGVWELLKAFSQTAQAHSLLSHLRVFGL